MDRSVHAVPWKKRLMQRCPSANTETFTSFLLGVCSMRVKEAFLPAVVLAFFALGCGPAKIAPSAANDQPQLNSKCAGLELEAQQIWNAATRDAVTKAFESTGLGNSGRMLELVLAQ